ncbi:NAD(P)-dependent oxidoreductase [Rhodopseudomonas boonkerdii]|nr:NAD(P)-dependent oxidoreductase [Rhodopseudomonas boonkerdii]UGV28502.1 NAD(P)-dependent oxidoreductase [Rhodopseudomonas boonkerdii]
METSSQRPVGFIGLGSMGEPMAINLCVSGVPLLVWNRTISKCESLEAGGAMTARTLEDVFVRSDIIFLMLSDHRAIDDVLSRDNVDFARRVRGKVIVNTSTVLPSYSAALEESVRDAGGSYIEAPVSGSRKPAEAGQLVAMLSGDAGQIERIRHLFRPMCRETFNCGEVPGALKMKLAVNLFLITMVTGLAEATHFARQLGLDLEKFISIVDAGPMASDVSRVKIRKLANEDFARQAGITDVLKNNWLVATTAREAGIASPLLDMCYDLYRETESSGFSELDMVAVVKAIARRDQMR